MSWEEVQLGELLVESRIPADNPDPNRRIRVKLHVEGVEKRPLENEMEGATKQFIRRAGQFIYGKQNFHKGAFGIVPDELDGFETSADIPSFDVREDCLPEWIYYFFKSGNRYLQLEKLARGVGSQRIHPKQIYDIAIPLPPKEKQWELIQDIINTESKFYDFAGEQSIQLDLLKKLRQQILQDAVEGKLITQNPNDEPAKRLLEQIKTENEKQFKEKKFKRDKPITKISQEEIKFEIPEKWTWCRLGEIADLNGRIGWKGLSASEYKETGPLFLSVHSLNYGDYVDYTQAFHISQERYDESPEIMLQNNDILICKDGAGIGKLGIIKELKEQATVNSSMLIIRCNSLLIIKYIYYYLLSSHFQNIVNSRIMGATTPHLYQRDLVNFLVALPPLFEQIRIVAKIEHLMKLCDNLEQTIQQNQKYTQELFQVALKEALEPRN